MSITRDSRLTAHQLTVLRVESLDAQVTVLGSKSYTNRYLAIASLSGQKTVIDHALLSDDTVYFARAIEAFGHVRVEVDHESERIHIRVVGGSFHGGATTISGRVSSQFTSSLVINAIRAEADTVITIVDELISKPYVEMTLAALAEMGVAVERDGYRRFAIRFGQCPRGGHVTVEPDASGMSYSTWRHHRDLRRIADGEGTTVHTPEHAAAPASNRGDEWVAPNVVTSPDGTPLATVQDQDALLLFNFRSTASSNSPTSLSRTSPAPAGR